MPAHRQYGACLSCTQPCIGAQAPLAHQAGHGGAVPHASYGCACAAPRGRGVRGRAHAAAEGGCQCPAGRRTCSARVGYRQAFSVPSVSISAAAWSQAPGKAWGLRKPWKGILPASLSGGTEYAVSCITCPDSRKRDSSHCVLPFFWVLYTILLRSELTAKALLLSMGTTGGRFAKTNKTSGPPVKTGGPLVHASKPRKFSILLSWQDIQRPSAAGFVPWRLFSLATP